MRWRLYCLEPQVIISLCLYSSMCKVQIHIACTIPVGMSVFNIWWNLGTENSLAESEGGYENITVARPMGVCDLDFLHFIHNSIQPGDTSADCIRYNSLYIVWSLNMS